MGRTIEIFPKTKKIYKQFFQSKVLNKILHQTLDLLINSWAGARQFYFPKKFSWDWKLEMLAGWYEKDTTALFKKIIQPGMTVVDIGAHIGYYTSLFAKLVGPKGRVYAFEADPDNFELLQKNTSRYKNVILVPQAVSKLSGFIKFYKIKGSTGCHSVIPTDNAEEITVPAVNLDDYISQKNLKINAIKIDIEGGEPLAFMGMEKLFSQATGLLLVMEFSPQALKSANINPLEFLQKIKNYRFSILQILPHAKTGILSLENIGDLDWYQTGYANLLLKK
ncbi:MAG: FkbM family methyltransferase [Candidatus Zambryskibacteria bacterium]